MCESSPELIRPLILGCETKQPKIIQICLASVHKVIEAKILNIVSILNFFLIIMAIWYLNQFSLI
jgi:hypothetical protein